MVVTNGEETDKIKDELDKIVVTRTIEVKLGTNPMIPEDYCYSLSDFEFIMNDDNFISNKYKKIYEDDELEQIGCWLGSNVFGSDHDRVITYKSYISNYISTAEKLEESNGLKNLIESQIVQDIKTTIDYTLQVVVDVDAKEYLALKNAKTIIHLLDCRRVILNKNCMMLPLKYKKHYWM